MHIGQFLSSGHVHHFLVKRPTDSISQIPAFQLCYQNDPVAFKGAVSGILDENTDDPGHRQLLKILLPLVAGKALASGLDVFSEHQIETAAHRNYLRLGETNCKGVNKWWQSVDLKDLRLV